VLNSLVGQTTRSRASKIRAARAEFMRQLDGTHLQQSEADWAALLMRHMPAPRPTAAPSSASRWRRGPARLCRAQAQRLRA